MRNIYQLKLDDKQFLDKVLDLFQLIHKNELVLLIDLNDIILFSGNTITDLIHVTLNDIVNKDYKKVTWLPAENIKFITKSINNVIKTKQSSLFLNINLFHTYEYIVLQGTIKPLINHDTNNIVAIAVESRKLDFDLNFYKILNIIAKHKALKANTTNTHTETLLSLREHEIVFLLNHCKTVENATELLNKFYTKPISSKTVYNIIRQQIYPKFDVYNLDNLINISQKLGYHKKIPSSFLINLHIDLNSI